MAMAKKIKSVHLSVLRAQISIVDSWMALYTENYFIDMVFMFIFHGFFFHFSFCFRRWIFLSFFFKETSPFFVSPVCTFILCLTLVEKSNAHLWLCYWLWSRQLTMKMKSHKMAFFRRNIVRLNTKWVFDIRLVFHIFYRFVMVFYWLVSRRAKGNRCCHWQPYWLDTVIPFQLATTNTIVQFIFHFAIFCTLFHFSP